MMYRITNAVRNAHYSFRTRGIRETPPLPCDPSARCELHTMLSARDLPMYLVALKSFLRFYQSVAVIVHSDGSLDECHAREIRYHAPGSRIIRHGEADDRAREELGEGSFLWDVRSIDASYRRVIDTSLSSLTGKRIIMDADILVLRPPTEVIEWIERGVAPFLIGQVPSRPPRPAGHPPRRPKHVQTIFREKAGEIARALELAPDFPDGTTSAFYGCSDQLPPHRVEALFRACKGLRIPMETWGGEQCTVIYLLAAAGAVRLDPGRYMNFGPDSWHKVDRAVLLHFFGTYRFSKNLYPSLSAGVVADLSRPRRVVVS